MPAPVELVAPVDPVTAPPGVLEVDMSVVVPVVEPVVDDPAGRLPVVEPAVPLPVVPAPVVADPAAPVPLAPLPAAPDGPVPLPVVLCAYAAPIVTATALAAKSIINFFIPHLIK